MDFHISANFNKMKNFISLIFHGFSFYKKTAVALSGEPILLQLLHQNHPVQCVFSTSGEFQYSGGVQYIGGTS